MAKQEDVKKAIGDIMGKQPGEAATPDDFSAFDEGNIRPTGVGLREGEIEALDAMGQILGSVMDAQPIARNALIRIAVRRLLEGYTTGEITADDLLTKFTRPEKPQPRLRL